MKLISTINDKLAQEALATLQSKNLKLGIAESCTGGLLSYHFTMQAGASLAIDGTMISYSNDIKAKWLGVSEVDLATYGAVSEVVVKAMCEGILAKTNADVALATSGIAGPSGGSELKPIGSVYVGAMLKGREPESRLFHFQGDRLSVQMQSCKAALDMLLALIA